MQLGKSIQHYNESYFCVFYFDIINIPGEPESWRYNYYIVRGEDVTVWLKKTESRLYNHCICCGGCVTTYSPSADSWRYCITIASGEDEESRTNRRELRHGSLIVACGGQAESPSNSRGDHHRGITSKFYVHKMSLKTSKGKVRCLYFDLVC
jgi:hypothetical protein